MSKGKKTKTLSDEEKLNKIFENYECEGQYAFKANGSELEIVEEKKEKPKALYVSNRL